MNADDADNPGTGVAAVILAAGLGTRMRSKTPKELHPIAGRPLLAYVLDACLGIQPDQVIVVLSPAKAAVVDTLPAGCEVAWQREPLGTGHAAAQALPLLRPEIEHVAVLFGDHPLLTTEAVERLVTTARCEGALVTLLTAELDDPAAYGRLRYRDGRIAGIVEAREDTATYSGKVEINSGISCYRRDWLEAALPHVPRSASGEYYLTALAEAARHPRTRSARSRTLEGRIGTVTCRATPLRCPFARNERSWGHRRRVRSERPRSPGRRWNQRQ